MSGRTLRQSDTLLAPAGAMPVVESSNFWAYGDSYVAGTGSSQSSRAFPQRIASKIIAPITAYNGVSGKTMGQVASIITGGASGYSAQGWTPGQSGLVLLKAVVNSVINITSANDAQEKVGFQTGLKAALRMLRAYRWIAETDASCAYTGTWSTASVVNSGGGSVKTTSTNGDYVTITVTQPEITLMMIGFPGATNGGFTVAVNGTPITPEVSTCNNQTTTAESYSIMSVRIPNLTGTSTIKLTSTSATGFYFDGYLTPWPAGSSGPPNIVVCKDAVPTVAGLQINGADTNRTAANLGVYNGYIDTICALPEFNDGRVQVADPQPWYDNTTMEYTAGRPHPNNWGHSAYAYAVLRAAERFRPNAGLNLGLAT